jgi:hypothetical protein
MLALGFALSTLPVQASQAAVESSELTLTAQNFHIYTSGNLRFVLEVNSQSLIDEFLSDSKSVFRVSLGQRVNDGEKQVRAINTATEEFVVTDSVDLTIREVTRRNDGQFELSGYLSCSRRARYQRRFAGGTADICQQVQPFTRTKTNAYQRDRGT